MNIQKLAGTVLLALICAFATICTGCVSQTPIPQYANNLKFAVLYVHDDTNELTSAPVTDEVAQSMNKVLSDRNLAVKPISFNVVRDDLTSIRDTERRIQALRNVTHGEQFLLITELSTEFYSPLSGRYRWNVNARITIYDMISHTTITDKITVPAVLMYAHETGDDAIESVSEDIERHIGSLVDRFLSGRRANAGRAKSAVQPQAALEAVPDSAAQDTAPPLQNEEASLDGGASPSPEAIYFILIDRFFNARKDNDLNVSSADPTAWHGGDLEGIRQKLPYLHDLGITKIWVSPAFLSASENFFGNAAFHAYWTYDLSKIDPHFGTEDDLKALAADAQKYDIGLILDFVVNHVGYGSPLIEQKPDWFHPALTIEDWNDPKQLTERQVHGLPDLDQSNPEVYNYIYGAAKKWLDLPNITGFRLDAVKHVDIEFWKKFNDALKEKHPGLMLLGEYFDGDPKKVDEVQKNGSFTHLFDFPLAFALRDVFCENKSLANLASAVANDRQYSAPDQMVTFLDNHDMPRFYSLCKGDDDAMARALRVLLAWRGIPSFYYGTETPLAGSKEPDNRSDMVFDNAKYTSLIKNALALRTQFPVLAFGKTAVLEYKKGFAAFGRRLKNQNAVLIVSQNSDDITYRLPQGAWLDTDSRQMLTGDIKIAPKSVRVLIQNDGPDILSHQRHPVTIRVPDDGYEYAVTGSIPELGMWNPKNAPKTSGNTPITLSLPAQTVVVYKLVRLNLDGTVQWAPGDNLEFFVRSPKKITLTRF